ncbi:MAG: OmpA family protein [Gammaproteobacteria bacterium]|nr:OmpA family protein [Gammaproteobacteria bacterium]
MGKPVCLLLILALTLGLGDARADIGDWYVIPSIVYSDDDGDRVLDDSIAGAQIQVGKEMGEHFWLEGLVGYHDIKAWPGYPDQQHLEFGLNAIGNLWSDRAFSPYVTGGIGFLSANPSSGSTDNDAIANAGIGFKIRFGDSRWSLRNEWRVRQLLGGDSLTDWSASLGIQFTFGDNSGMPVPAAVAAAPMPEPEPVTAPDGDGDGVYDSRDACPGTPHGLPVNSSGCPADSDQDSVTDDLDQCPGTVGGVEVDQNGCEIREVIDLKGVLFENDSDVLIEGSSAVLNGVASTLIRYPDLRVEIAGHTDSRGAANDNMVLSLRRAYAVRAYLMDRGVNPANLTVRGYGESRPVASNLTEAGQAENRRVELRVLSR